MADIAGLGANTGFDATQQNARVEERQRVAENDTRLRDEEQRQAAQEQTRATRTETNTTQGVNQTGAPATAGATQATEESAPNRAGGGFTSADLQDRVTLSAAAQDALATTQIAAAPPPPAAGEADAAPPTSAADTNQTVRLENTTATVRGNENNENEQVRTLGQIVDQFA